VNQKMGFHEKRGKSVISCKSQIEFPNTLYYTKIHGVAPAEADLQRYFQTSPPAIHQMIVTLEKRGLIDRVPGQARSIRLRLTRDQLPDLE